MLLHSRDVEYMGQTLKQTGKVYWITLAEVTESREVVFKMHQSTRRDI